MLQFHGFHGFPRSSDGFRGLSGALTACAGRHRQMVFALLHAQMASGFASRDHIDVKEAQKPINMCDCASSHVQIMVLSFL